MSSAIEMPLAMAKGSERRRWSRHSRSFLAKIRVVGGSMPKDVGDRIIQVRNVSQGGLLISSKRPFQRETLVEIKVPDNALGAAKTLNGKVCWTTDAHENGDYDAGLTFVRITPPGKAPATKPSAPAPAPEPEEKAPAGSERRAFPRVGQRLLLKLHCVSKGIFFEELERGGILLDLSRDGVELSTGREYPPGAILQIRFPDSPLGPTHQRHAKVIWTRPSEKPGQFLTGVKFIILSGLR